MTPSSTPCHVSNPLSGSEDRTIAQRLEVEQGLSMILDRIGDAFFSLSSDWRFTYVNRAAEMLFQVPRETLLGQVIWDALPWSAETELSSRLERVLSSGEPESFEINPVGTLDRYLELDVFPYNGGLGVTSHDWTERRLAEEELRESQARLSVLADNLPISMVYQTCYSDTRAGRKFLYLSATCEQLNGVPAEEALKDPMLLYNLLLPGHSEHLLELEGEAFRTHKPFDTEIALRHARTGETRWQRLFAKPRKLADGTVVWDGIQIEITDQKKAEERLKLLVNELNHRVKNTLAIVQSLAAQSFRKVEDQHDEIFSSARQAFEARLFALPRSHDVLTRENWESASLEKILTEACAAYRIPPDRGGTFDIQGHDIRISPAMALSLSMALHELCTNALKYGALGVPGGCIAISWSTESTGSRQRLLMRWEERGGPPVSPPTHKGFGSRLIEGSLARELGGTVTLAFEPEGVICTIDVPLDMPLS